jgi:hypothetical protein
VKFYVEVARARYSVHLRRLVTTNPSTGSVAPFRNFGPHVHRGEARHRCRGHIVARTKCRLFEARSDTVQRAACTKSGIFPLLAHSAA